MKRGFLFTLSAISLNLSANTVVDFNTLQTIELDFLLDGQINSSSSTKDYDLSGSKSLFIGKLENTVLAGSTSADEKLIKFELSQPDTGEIHYFVGKLTIDDSYKGTWFSNSGGEGDWQINISSPAVYQSCNEILQAGQSQGDGVYSIQSQNGTPISVYCDMTTDDGGWTLVGSYPKTAPGGQLRVTDYSNEPETNPDNPTRLWLYQGSLSPFSAAREQISCAAAKCTDGNYAYADNLTEVELQKVRYSWGANDRVEQMPSYRDMPTCRNAYDPQATEFTGCVRPEYLDVYTTNSTVVGWQTATGSGYCWAARGTHSSGSLGSGRCGYNLEPNGTRWALLWMR
ncbi:fibrinogen-like YCDxxxxGGGW domain-containing protein [Pseudoalteromonas sp. T1lg23B]|uniref:fibrinogen-like YCDxxxxGGGW domain-containing protein n=1 Tax=Pseudoalteromonas sp. T1lg23B TaxID=2077097 RepID=UPI000CF725AC|nr:fibrinogen-like YCDxxxxGGGW domain-containing protein [Pseudoalteromonas sp. T1lg23B]